MKPQVDFFPWVPVGCFGRSFLRGSRLGQDSVELLNPQTGSGRVLGRIEGFLKIIALQEDVE